MEKLLYTPDEIAEQRIIPYCAEEIRRLVRRGEIPAVRRQGRRILIHYKDLEAYADKFRLSHTEPVEGPHTRKRSNDVPKTAPSRTGRRPAAADADRELGELLGLR